MLLFKILWGIDALVSVVIFYFFFVGLADGTVSPRNAGVWSVVVLLLVGVMGGSMWLKNSGHAIPAVLLALALALPALLFVAYTIMILCTKDAWR